MEGGELSEKDILSGLNSKETSRLYDSLTNLRRNYVANVPKMRSLALAHGVVAKVIEHVEHPKLCNIALSIISNICMDDCLRDEVIKCNGILSLARIVKGLANSEILNRACRAIGNIALTEYGLSCVHETMPVAGIVAFLNSSVLEEHQMTAVRTLRIIGRSKKTFMSLVREDAICAIAKLMCLSEKPRVISCSLKALAVLTHNCRADAAQQVGRAEVLPELVRFYTTSKDLSVRDNALACLQNLARVSAMREELGEAGAFRVFIDVANHNDHRQKVQSAVLALCFCCGEYWDRKQIRNLGGLCTLVNILKSDQYECIHRHIVTALNSLCSEMEGTSELYKSKLFEVLLEKLKIFISKNKGNHAAEDNLCSEKLDLSEGSEHEINEELDVNMTGKVKRIKSESSKLHSRTSSSDAVYSIHSPTYQGVQYSDLLNGSLPCTSSYASFQSPQAQASSPECYSFDWNPNSPISCSSMLSPWSPSSSSNDNQNMCWSPVLSSRSHSPDSSDELGNPLNVEEDSKIDRPSPNVETCRSNLVTLNDVPVKFSNSDRTVPQEADSVRCLLTSESGSGMCAPSQKSSEDHACFKTNSSYIRTPLCSDVKTCIDSAFRKNSCSDKSSVGNLQSSSQCDAKSSSSLKGTNKRASSSTSCETVGENLPIIPKVMPHLSESTKSTKNNCFKRKQSNIHSGKRFDHYILLLLSHLTREFLKTTYWDSLDELLMDVFIQYLSVVPSPNMRAIKVLKNVIVNHNSFQKLITWNFVQRVEKAMVPIHDVKICNQCLGVQSTKQELLVAVKVMANSSFGFDTLNYILQAKNTSHQLRCLYACSQFFHQMLPIFKILERAKGLDILIDSLIASNDNEILEIASVTLSHFWCTLHLFTWPSIKQVRKSACDLYCKYTYMSKNGGFDLKLLPQNSSHVLAVRQQLCDRSDYFQGLLGGSFIEASQNVIVIPTVSGEVLLYVMHYLHGCQPGWCPILSDIPRQDLHKLFQACDLFMLDSLKDHTQLLMLSEFKMEMAVSLYTALKMHGSERYSQYVLFLVLRHGHLYMKEFVPCLQELFKLHKNDVVQYIKNAFILRFKKL